METNMKIIILTILCFLCLCANKTLYEVPKDLLDAIHIVESGGRKENVPMGDNNLARGPFQIHKEFWVDSKIPGEWENCDNYDYSVRVINAYMNKYAQKAIIDKDFEKIARIFNGGPRGDKKKSTLKYWEKVKKYLKD